MSTLEDRRRAKNRRKHELRRLDPVHNLLDHARQRAKRKGLEFSLRRVHIVIPPVCPVLGIPISKINGVTHHGSPSIDRIDNAKGYVPGNVRVISYRANSLKSNATPDEIRLVYMDILSNASGHS
jgi:hypothetical protein